MVLSVCAQGRPGAVTRAKQTSQAKPSQGKRQDVQRFPAHGLRARGIRFSTAAASMGSSIKEKEQLTRTKNLELEIVVRTATVRESGSQKCEERLEPPRCWTVEIQGTKE